MKKIASLLTGVLFILNSACQFEASGPGGTSKTSSSGSSSSTSTVAADVKVQGSGSSFSSNQKIYINLSDQTVSIDNSSWNQITTTSLDFFGDTIKVKFTQDDSKVSTGVIRVDAEDTGDNLSVYLTGKKEGGGVKIQLPMEYEVGIYIEDISITSSNYPCLEVTKGGAATLFLSGTNVFTDGRKYGYGYGSDHSASKNPVTEGSDSKGSLYCKGGLTICGDGSLTVAQAYKNCIASKDGILKIESGNLSLSSYISASTAGSSSDTGKNGLFGGQGIEIAGGNIEYKGKGIISSSDMRKANGLKTDDEDYPSSYVKITGGNLNVATYNGKGINAPKIFISGGSNKFSVTGTTAYSERTSTGSWYDADGELESGTVKFAPEGIEAESLIEISGGKTIISSPNGGTPDDGVNVSASGGSLTISDGFLYVYSSGDGLDCNGNITVSGGQVVVSQTGGGNSPIDCGDGSYSFSVKGGTIFAMGASDMFSESIPSSTSVPYIYSTSLSGSSSLAVSDSSGNAYAALASPLSYGGAIFVSSSLTSGSSYNFVRGAEITGEEFVEETGFYLPPEALSGGSSTSVSATTQGGSGSGFGGGPGSSGGFSNRPW